MITILNDDLKCPGIHGISSAMNTMNERDIINTRLNRNDLIGIVFLRGRGLIRGLLRRRDSVIGNGWNERLGIESGIQRLIDRIRRENDLMRESCMVRGANMNERNWIVWKGIGLSEIVWREIALNEIVWKDIVSIKNGAIGVDVRICTSIMISSYGRVFSHLFPSS
jgi:hypothetical protein